MGSKNLGTSWQTIWRSTTQKRNKILRKATSQESWMTITKSWVAGVRPSPPSLMPWRTQTKLSWFRSLKKWLKSWKKCLKKCKRVPYKRGKFFQSIFLNISNGSGMIKKSPVCFRWWNGFVLLMNALELNTWRSKSWYYMLNFSSLNARVTKAWRTFSSYLTLTARATSTKDSSR